MNNEIITQTAVYVRSTIGEENTGHDWWHCLRVWNMSKTICKSEPRANQFIVELAAILHDISDWKFNNGDDSAGPRVASAFLKQHDVKDEEIDHVCNIIATMSFKGAKTATPMLTLEGKIVQDADRLDAIGAIGIARAFAYGSFRGQEIHNPNIKPQEHKSYEEYKHAKGTTINHFYEKLLLLKDRMNTNAAKKIAEERHKFMQDYLSRFYKEWDGLR